MSDYPPASCTDTDRVDDTPSCFPGSASVETPTGIKRMRDVRIGDYVRTNHGDQDYSRVYSFGHFDASKRAQYMQVYLDSFASPLEVSQNHLVMVNGSFIKASEIQVGDELSTGIVTKIELQWRRGLFAPITETGTIVVNGVFSSCYVALFGQVPYQHQLTHLLLTPIRGFCSWTGCEGETYIDGLSSKVHWFVGLVGFFGQWWMQTITVVIASGSAIFVGNRVVFSAWPHKKTYSI